MHVRLRRPARLLLVALAVMAAPRLVAAQAAQGSLALAEPLPIRPVLAALPDSTLSLLAAASDTTALDPAAIPVIRPLAALLAGGLVAGTTGFLGGAYAADKVSRCTPGCTDAGYTGASIGLSILLPVGIHLASGGEGSLRKSMLVSTGIAAIGFGILKAGVLKPDVVHLIVPVAQIATLLSIR